MGGVLVFAIIACFCGALFIILGLYSIKKKGPIHFWAGTKVKDKEIKDIKAYNRANGIMWIIYGSTYFLAALLALMNIKLGAIIFTIAGTAGTMLLIPAYNYIYNKYKA